MKDEHDPTWTPEGEPPSRGRLQILWEIWESQGTTMGFIWGTLISGYFFSK